jgi:hypothetical protein
VLEVNAAVDCNPTYADDVFATAAEALLERAAPLDRVLRADGLSPWTIKRIVRLAPSSRGRGSFVAR